MTITYTKEETIGEILKQARKLDKLELQILLTKLRVKTLRKKATKTAVNRQNNISVPTLEEIDLWKHQSRNQ
mgnify:FL=1